MSKTHIFGITDLVTKTGQTTKYVDGDDGDLELGLNLGFVDNGDGTITDRSTNLMWAKDPAKIFPTQTGEILSAEGAWQTGFSYIKGDLVYNSFQTVNNPVWAQYTTYTAGQFVKDLNQGYRYVCILGNVANDYQPGIATDWATKWSNQTMTTWQTGGSYTDGQIVYDMGYVLECLVDNVASQHQPGVDSDWADVWVQIADYQDATSYTTGQKVTAGGGIYVAKSNFTSNSAVDYPGMGSDWATYWDGPSYPNQWSANTSYTAGDYVYSPNDYKIYECTVTHYSSNHQYNNSPDGDTYWSNLGYMGWSSGTTYSVDTYVTNYVSGEYKLYKCTSEHTASKHEPNSMDMDYSTYWANASLTSWNSGVSYVVGQPVTSYGINEYVCKLDHTSAYDDQPGIGVNWTTYWTLVITAFVCTVSHTSGASTEPYWGASASDKWVETPWNYGSTLTGTAYFNWADAIAYCNALVWNGYSDWRMPNYREMETLVNHESYNPCINETFFPNTMFNGSYSIGYWTSTTEPANTSYAKFMDFWNQGGNRSYSVYGQSDYKTYPYNSMYCRPVRSLN